MKTLFLILLVWATASGLNAQSQTFKGNIDRSTTVEMTIRIKNDIAYIHRSTLPFDAKVGSGIFNTTDLLLTDKVISAPMDGATYWIVPFDGNVHEFTVEPPYFCYDCACLDEGSCDSDGKRCYIDSCNTCALLVYPCGYRAGLNFIFSGSFALVKAREVRSE